VHRENDEDRPARQSPSGQGPRLVRPGPGPNLPLPPGPPASTAPASRAPASPAPISWVPDSQAPASRAPDSPAPTRLPTAPGATTSPSPRPTTVSACPVPRPPAGAPATRSPYCRDGAPRRFNVIPTPTQERGIRVCRKCCCNPVRGQLFDQGLRLPDGGRYAAHPVRPDRRRAVHARTRYACRIREETGGEPPARRNTGPR
jgi:hypothetical protein